MESSLQALELMGTINEQRQIELDAPLPLDVPKRVRVIVLYPVDDELDGKEWLRHAATNPAFDFLHDPAEDIYTSEDGKPLSDEG